MRLPPMTPDPTHAPRLVYVMGPSGAGKDAVLAFARGSIDGGAAVVFAHRYATRPPSPGHPNEVALSAREFGLRERTGLFTFVWDAYGVRYAVGTEVWAWRARGLVTVVSGSRDHFVHALQTHDAVLPVVVTASAAERARRLEARRREDARAIAERLVRGDAFAPRHPALVTIDNDGPLEVAGAALVGLLVAEARRASAAPPA